LFLLRLNAGSCYIRHRTTFDFDLTANSNVQLPHRKYATTVVVKHQTLWRY